jgi:mono/diheme cytochrome c family protein
MKASYRLAFIVLILIAAGAGAARLLSGEDAPQAAPKASAGQGAQGDVEHGRYLVDDVAMCSECHTPRDASGNLDNSRYLQGAQIWITPVHPTNNWAMRAPALSGEVGFTDAQMQEILEKGIGPDGLEIQPPMHIYHMSHADAVAISAYLRSLPNTFPH